MNQDDLKKLRTRTIKRTRLWVDQLHLLNEAINHIAQVVEAGTGRGPDEKLTAVFGESTRIPTARAQLKGVVARFNAVGGPSLPICQKLAEAQDYVLANQLLGDVCCSLDKSHGCLQHGHDSASL